MNRAYHVGYKRGDEGEEVVGETYVYIKIIKKKIIHSATKVSNHKD